MTYPLLTDSNEDLNKPFCRLLEKKKKTECRNACQQDIMYTFNWLASNDDDDDDDKDNGDEDDEEVMLMVVMTRMRMMMITMMMMMTMMMVMMTISLGYK